MTSRAFRLCMVCAVCLLPMMVHAGVVANLTQIEFESGQTTFAPGSKGTVRFMASYYAFGGGQFAYLTVAVVPIGSPLLNPRLTDTVKWDVYGVLIRTLAMPTFAEAASPYEVSFVAPLKPGKYRLVWGQVPSLALQEQ
jgi:hypothetical protein